MPTDKLKPGRVSNFTNSMAEAMDEAFREEWRSVKGSSLPRLGQEDRRILLVAIAQGIAAHLKEHANAINVRIDLADGAANTTVDISLDGVMEILTR